MSKVQMLRVLVNQRLTAAAEEIFVLFERTIAEYEEELSRSKEEKERQRKLLDVFVTPEVRLHRADVQHLLENKEEVPPEQQERSSSLDQEDLEPPHIKEEQEELWTSREGEELQVLEEADVITFMFTPVPVKNEGDEETPPSSQPHQRQTEEKRVAEHSQTEADVEDCGGSEAARNSDPDRHLEPVSHYNSLQVYKHVAKQNDNEKSNVLKCNTVQSFNCSECGKKFAHKHNVKSHMLCHTEERPYGCSICGKRFRKNATLARHVKIHAEKKPYTCLVCNSSFSQRGSLSQHMRIHTGEKPFSCSICGKEFTQKGSVKEHMTVHTGKRPFNCSVCGKGFNRRSYIKNHKCVVKRK